jgi:hypothetical protein
MTAFLWPFCLDLLTWIGVLVYVTVEVLAEKPRFS